jgi:hypothetical protein
VELEEKAERRRFAGGEKGQQAGKAEAFEEGNKQTLGCQHWSIGPMEKNLMPFSAHNFAEIFFCSMKFVK